MSIESLYQKAQQSIKDKDYEQAVAYFDQVIQLNPQDADAYSERGVSKFHLNDLKGALRDMNISLELEPDNAYRYSSRAYILEKSGDTEAAIRDYRKSIELDPDNAVSYNNLGLLEEKLGYMQMAKKRYAMADELSKRDIDLIGSGPDNPSQMVNELLDELDIEVNDPPEKTSIWTYFFSVFTSSKSRKEYFRFVKRMFSNRDR